MALTKVTFSMIDSAAVNAKDYGAVAGGIVDSSDAVQAAVNATPDGGTLLIPATYLVQDIKITKSINIVGSNGGGFKAKTTSGNGNVSSNNILYTDTTNIIQKIVLHNLEFDGSSTGNVTSHRQALIKTFNVPQVQLTDCFITKHSADETGITYVISEHYDLAVVAIWYSRDVLAENNRFLDNYAEKLWIQGAITYFTNVSVRFNHWEAGSVQGASCLNCIRCSGLVDNNYSDYNQGSAYNLLGANDMTVSNNIINRATSSFAIDFVEGGIYTADNIVVQGNYISNCAYGIAVWGNNIHILDNTLKDITNSYSGILCNGVTDAGDSIYYSAAELAAGLLPVASDYRGMWICGNYLKNLTAISPPAETPSWIIVGNAIPTKTWTDVFIEKNSMSSAASSCAICINMTNVSNSQIRNNRLKDFTFAAVVLQCRSTTTLGIDSIIIDGNYIDNTVATGSTIIVNPLTVNGRNLVQVTNNLFVTTPPAAKYLVFCQFINTLVFQNNNGSTRLRSYIDNTATIISLTYQNQVVYVSAAPTTETWAVSDVAMNVVPTVGQPKGWICTVAGTPGTWVSLGNL